MTDFNKGDFTQQGVNGHVNAKVRLNAKRYLDIDLTSNEQASGCTTSGHVYDSLNDITYPIGSAPSGNIEITENTAEGEPLDISQYATATVNVSGESILKCTITIVNDTDEACDPIDAFDDMTAINFSPYVNGIIDLSSIPATIEADSSITIDFLYCKTGQVINVASKLSSNVTSSNLENCTVSNYMITPIDNTENCSLTVTFSPK